MRKIVNAIFNVLRGYARKKVLGRKRQAIGDTDGGPLVRRIQPASLQDRDRGESSPCCRSPAAAFHLSSARSPTWSMLPNGSRMRHAPIGGSFNSLLATLVSPFNYPAGRSSGACLTWMQPQAGKTL